MNTQTDPTEELLATVQAMMTPGKGVLAIDESHGTCTKRFTALGVECTEATRREYRGLLVEAPGIEEAVSSYIMFDETLRQANDAGTPFTQLLTQKGIVPGIKVDTGAKPLALSLDETVTEGLDGLRDRLTEYKSLGARFAKWRAVIRIGEGTPSVGAIQANVHALARYAALCQEQGIVPMVEPEVLIDGDHSLELCYSVTENVLKELFKALYDQNVMFEGVILKTSMVISGTNAEQQATPEEVAAATIDCLYNSVPASIGGVVFLSGGQTAAQATEHLNLMNQMGLHPWGLTFSYGRAIQQPALNAWNGQKANIAAAQKALVHRATMNGMASLAQWTPEAEKAA